MNIYISSFIFALLNFIYLFGFQKNPMASALPWAVMNGLGFAFVMMIIHRYYKS